MSDINHFMTCRFTSFLLVVVNVEAEGFNGAADPLLEIAVTAIEME